VNRIQGDMRHVRAAGITAALVFFIQLLGGEGKGEVLGNREQGRGN
jgi:hypothetical protein